MSTSSFPTFRRGCHEDAREATLKRLLDAHLALRKGPLVAWYYTPMMLPFSRHIEPDALVFDAMDELSKFKFAPAKLLDLEQELIERADVVFTGGSSLYEAKKDRHHNVHCFPSSVDRAHFAKARSKLFDPADQEDLPRPRLGFYGVIDERFDTELLARVAEMRPDWSFVMVGPVVKISEEDLPKRPNIHYLGGKTYRELPAYLSGWDVALMPFAMNEFDAVHLADQDAGISRRREARGLYANQGRRAPLRRDRGREDCLEPGRVRRCLRRSSRAFAQSESDWLAEADLMLSASSWDTTQARMAGLIADVLGTRSGATLPALLVAAE